MGGEANYDMTDKTATTKRNYFAMGTLNFSMPAKISAQTLSDRKEGISKSKHSTMGPSTGKEEESRK